MSASLEVQMLAGGEYRTADRFLTQVVARQFLLLDVSYF
jgi:hypothetical protein